MATEAIRLQRVAERQRRARTDWAVVRSLLSDPVTLTALVILTLVIFMAISADLLAPHDPAAQNLRLRNLPPMTPSVSDNPFPHVFGTDPLGRDILSRIIFGARTSIVVGVTSMLVSGLTGSLLGIIAGYYGGWIDDVIMRFVDIQMSIPTLLFALLVLFVIGTGFLNLVLVLAAFRWMLYARIARGQALNYRNAAFVDAAKAMGSSHIRIIFRHIVPNVASPLIVLGTTEVALLILSEASLSFLGFGLQSPDVSWGAMVDGGRPYIATAWWVTFFPGFTILLTTLSINLLAATLRAISDPIQRERWLSRTLHRKQNAQRNPKFR